MVFKLALAALFLHTALFPTVSAEPWQSKLKVLAPEHAKELARCRESNGLRKSLLLRFKPQATIQQKVATDSNRQPTATLVTASTIYTLEDGGRTLYAKPFLKVKMQPWQGPPIKKVELKFIARELAKVGNELFVNCHHCSQLTRFRADTLEPLPPIDVGVAGNMLFGSLPLNKGLFIRTTTAQGYYSNNTLYRLNVQPGKLATGVTELATVDRGLNPIGADPKGVYLKHAQRLRYHYQNQRDPPYVDLLAEDFFRQATPGARNHFGPVSVSEDGCHLAINDSVNRDLWLTSGMGKTIIAHLPGPITGNARFGGRYLWIVKDKNTVLRLDRETLALEQVSYAPKVDLFQIIGQPSSAFMALSTTSRKHVILHTPLQ